jgi:hypothetical protein
LSKRAKKKETTDTSSKAFALRRKARLITWRLLVTGERNQNKRQTHTAAVFKETGDKDDCQNAVACAPLANEQRRGETELTTNLGHRSKYLHQQQFANLSPKHLPPTPPSARSQSAATSAATRGSTASLLSNAEKMCAGVRRDPRRYRQRRKYRLAFIQRTQREEGTGKIQYADIGGVNNREEDARKAVAVR